MQIHTASGFTRDGRANYVAQAHHKRLIPRDALQAFALIESRVQATVEGSSFPFLGGIGRFVPNPRLSDLTDKLDKLRDEFREATLDFVAGYSPLRENAMAEWREAARHMNGSAERLIPIDDAVEWPHNALRHTAASVAVALKKAPFRPHFRARS